jgi:glycosyltransferase involved in cell wall biosynthesis
LPLHKKILLFVGRLSEEKGILEVLNCIDVFKNRGEFLFLIIGDGPIRPLVEKRLKSNKNALFLGPKRRCELVDYYNAADLLLWGSIDAHYVSITIMEALHCGLPVIAPNTSTQGGKTGIKEFYIRQDTLPPAVGMLFKGDVKSLVKAIDDFFNKKFDRKEIKKYALEKYSEKNVNLILSEFG